MESSPDSLTLETRFFLEPASPAQRQYEALRAYFVEGVSSADVSQRFGYTRGSFRVLCHHFRRSKPAFFRELKHGPHTQPKKDGSSPKSVISVRRAAASERSSDRWLQ